MALTPQNSDAFIREVDEELRRDQVLGFWTRYGRVVLIAVLVGLALFGGFLYWRHWQAQQAGKDGEALTAAVEQLNADRIDAARPQLQQLAGSDRAAYRAAAQLALGAVATQQGRFEEAATAFGKAAQDQTLPKPHRDLALIRQTTAEFDGLAPDQVIARLQPLARPGQPFFGSAAELVAVAHLKAGRTRQAGDLFAAIAKSPAAPPTLRSRAVQITSLLGVDVGPVQIPSNN